MRFPAPSRAPQPSRDRRRLPLVHWLLLLTCLALAGLVAFQQRVIENQGALIHLMSRDSSELAAIKVAESARVREADARRE